MFWYRMCVVTEGGRIYRFGENKRVEFNPPPFPPFQYVCVCVYVPIRVGKARTCTVVCTHCRFTIKYSLEGGVSAEKYSVCPPSSEGYLM
jgi:hypothetical protein